MSSDEWVTGGPFLYTTRRMVEGKWWKIAVTPNLMIIKMSDTYPYRVTLASSNRKAPYLHTPSHWVVRFAVEDVRYRELHNVIDDLKSRLDSFVVLEAL